MTIRTIVNENVAIRCDGCREIIPGTPWRVNLLDIVAPEVAVGWDEHTPLNPGPHQFHSDAACVRRWMAERGYWFCRRGEVREIMRPVAAAARPARLGPVRRHPPRRARVRPRLIRAARTAAARGFDGPFRAPLHSPPPGAPRRPSFTQFRRQPNVPGDEPGVSVSDDRSRADRPLPERLALGEASRLLGVDPDTLRRWADEGRVPAFTTPGGHRRFERRALERLVASRRTGPGERPRGSRCVTGPAERRVSPAVRRGAWGGPRPACPRSPVRARELPRVGPPPRRRAGPPPRRDRSGTGARRTRRGGPRVAPG